ncbi:protein trunk isoform X1 [Lucilia cuprina]|uniref:protein trunk isoform X1 n=1 Tax=Lucilia cuprina TaxID=7375 RepID=UPI001F05FBA5|nr:protein trunk isoform X1 [Lucilia cuprina]XP_046812708.1 protein trunk isoform X1 [Lucilia cuprina]XP_046812709.1 protein trunk isoform X1 [Lucilia cuprina]
MKYILQLYLVMGFTFKIISTNYCKQLSTKSLTKIHGQAFNPRYMSIEPPTSNHDASSKRSSYELPFYADDDVVSVGDFPAWETEHVNFYEKKKESTLKQRSIRITNIFNDRTIAKSDVFKTRPWECSSKLAWIDLGLHYFPRYIRSVECISKKCWYGNFNCKAKSFTIKILKRKNGSCIRISEKLLMVVLEEFDSDYTELWVWEEISINFCCDCVMLR